MKDSTMLLPYVKLHFNIDHPSLEECYVYGYECANAEIGEEENPYPVGSKANEHWLEGWWAGFYGEEPLFTLPNVEQSELENTAANDLAYHDASDSFIIKLLEISGMIAVSAFVGYQLIELVA